MPPQEPIASTIANKEEETKDAFPTKILVNKDEDVEKLLLLLSSHQNKITRSVPSAGL